MSALLRTAYRVQRWLWKVLRPRTRGVKVMIFNATGEVLLIRNSYGSSHLFVLPGGGVRPWERPEDAALREIREELGCELQQLTFVSTHVSHAEGKRDTIHLFEGICSDLPRPDCIEVAEARYFALEDLPQSLSPATARRLAERRGYTARVASW